MYMWDMCMHVACVHACGTCACMCVSSECSGSPTLCLSGVWEPFEECKVKFETRRSMC